MVSFSGFPGLQQVWPRPKQSLVDLWWMCAWLYGFPGLQQAWPRPRPKQSLADLWRV